MNFKAVTLMLALSFFSCSTMALNEDQWDYKEKVDNLKSTPGCQSKEEATAQAQSPYRVKKYSQIACQADGYGWNLDEVLDSGSPVCDECAGDDKGKYSCHLANVKVKCKIVKRGW